jgi:hypothetical protein
MTNRKLRVAIASAAVLIGSWLTTLPASPHGSPHLPKQAATTLPCYRFIGPMPVHAPSGVGHQVKGPCSHMKSAKRGH